MVGDRAYLVTRRGPLSRLRTRAGSARRRPACRPGRHRLGSSPTLCHCREMPAVRARLVERHAVRRGRWRGAAGPAMWRTATSKAGWRTLTRRVVSGTARPSAPSRRRAARPPMRVPHAAVLMFLLAVLTLVSAWFVASGAVAFAGMIGR
jgi:hypothetical protein